LQKGLGAFDFPLGKGIPGDNDKTVNFRKRTADKDADDRAAGTVDVALSMFLISHRDSTIWSQNRYIYFNKNFGAR
jgi:hypothetical protein